MKTKHIFWGLFLITIGVLILLNNLGSLYIDLQDVWKFWPLVLVILGLSFLVKNNIVKSFLAALAALVLAVAIFAFFNSAFYFVDNRFTINDKGISVTIDGDVDTSNYNVPYNADIKNAKFNLKAGAGSFVIDDTTGQLLSAVTTGIKNNYALSRHGNNNSVIELTMKNRKFAINDGNLKNKAFIKLNTNPVWDFNFDVGAASVDFDLSLFKTNKIKVRMGAASCKIKLGDKSDVTNLNLKSGISSIDILVPDSAGCQISTDLALSIKDFSGFSKVSDGTYRTANFDTSKNKIYLNLHTGVSSIKVERYSKGW